MESINLRSIYFQFSFNFPSRLDLQNAYNIADNEKAQVNAALFQRWEHEVTRKLN